MKARLMRTARLLGSALALVTFSLATTTATSAGAAASSGPVYGWGGGATGASGNVLTPIKVSLPAGITATDIAAGSDLSAAVGSDGLVYLWGGASGGVPGGGPTYPVSVSLPGGVPATAVAAGLSFVLALGEDGNVYSWGVDGVGELGTGSPNTDESTPTKVLLPTGNVTSIAAGDDQGFALTATGDVYGWGGDYYGQVGDSATHQPGGINTPTLLEFGGAQGGISAISAGPNMSMALTSAGDVYAWGFDGNDQIGPNCSPADAFDYCSAPTEVTGGASAIAAGGNDGLALIGGEVYSWGVDTEGELGRGIGAPASATPGPVSLPVAATGIAEGDTHGAAIGSDGNVYSWGANGEGEVGDGTQAERDLPVETNLPSLAAGTVPDKIVAGRYQSLLVTGPARIAPQITSGARMTLAAKKMGAFTVVTTGAPTSEISEVGKLPNGVGFFDQHTGIAIISGETTATGSFPITIVAANGVAPDASQHFTLTVVGVPTITSPASTKLVLGSYGKFKVTTSGFPFPRLSETKTLPPGVKFVDNKNGTASIAGTPRGRAKRYVIDITAKSSQGTAKQVLTLIVRAKPRG